MRSDTKGRPSVTVFQRISLERLVHIGETLLSASRMTGMSITSARRYINSPIVDFDWQEAHDVFESKFDYIQETNAKIPFVVPRRYDFDDDLEFTAVCDVENRIFGKITTKRDKKDVFSTGPSFSLNHHIICSIAACLLIKKHGS